MLPPIAGGHNYTQSLAVVGPPAVLYTNLCILLPSPFSLSLTHSLTPAPIARGYNGTYQHQLLLHEADNMKPVPDSLNYLSSCPWQINTRVSNKVINRDGEGKEESEESMWQNKKR